MVTHRDGIQLYGSTDQNNDASHYERNRKAQGNNSYCKLHGGIHHVNQQRPAYQRWQPQGGARWSHGGGSLLKAKLLIEAPSNADRNFSGTLSDSIENYDFIAFFNIAYRTSKGGSDNTFFAFHRGKKVIEYTNTGVEVTVTNGTQLTFKGSGSSSDYYFVAAVGFKL